MKSSKDIVFNQDSSVRFVIKAMNSKKVPIVAIVDSINKLVGIMTDGDIRRAYEQGMGLDDKIINFTNLFPKVLKTTQFPLSPYKFNTIKKFIAVPVIDENKIFQYFYYPSKFENVSIIDNPVFIMAGGFGKRLKPYTNFCPKPMLKVNGKPIIVHIIENMNRFGFNNIHLILHHMPEVFEDYFKNKKFLNNTIQLHFEKKPLGTVGGIYQLKHLINKDFFVLNGDNIVNADWSTVIKNHINKKNEVTVCCSNYSVQIPYGVVEVNNENNITNIIEKPLYNWKTICSAYCFSRKSVDLIKEDKFQDMPTILGEMISKNLKIGFEEVFSFQRIEDLVDKNKQYWDR